ncbi:hypothetical protein GPN2_12912 [Streptomyces murinus]
MAHADRITVRAVRQHLPSHRDRESRRHDDPRCVLPRPYFRRPCTASPVFCVLAGQKPGVS